jgi:2-polyprenyl-6-hydroxyphenyl methylase/3-demethylubiquinone-9 3-methyltransferase
MAALPARYLEPWDGPFRARIEERLRPGIAILDVGAGRRPTLPPSARPSGCRYVGLDISADELAAAPDGSYDETWVADATRRVPELEGCFDLVISFQVLEHVKPLDAAFDNFRAYLRPGGSIVAQFSGTFSFFALAGRVFPDRLTRWLVSHLTDRPPTTIFPAHYDRCWDGAIRTILAGWTQVEVQPRYLGAGYLRFLPPARRLYLVYEEWARRSRRRNLATHYLVAAER